jgi:hypothetical protein
LRNSVKVTTTKTAEDKAEDKKSTGLLKSMLSLFILPLMEISYKIKEEADILTPF